MGERPIALLNRRWLTGAHRRDARATINVDGGKADRTFEQQIHADGRGWGKGCTFDGNSNLSESVCANIKKRSTLLINSF